MWVVCTIDGDILWSFDNENEAMAMSEDSPFPTTWGWVELK